MKSNPGTQEALEKGCTCAVIDNHYGRGYQGEEGVFIYTEGCPVHHNFTSQDPLTDEKRENI